MTEDSNIILEKPVKIYKNVEIANNNKIGKYTYIRPFTYTNKNTNIGRYCSIGDYVIIGASKHPTNWLSTHTFQYDINTKFPGSKLYSKVKTHRFNFSETTVIGNDVWIGSRALIMQGVKVGHGSIIGAGAIISKNVEPYSIVVGSNQIIKKRFSSDIIDSLLKYPWWDLNEDVISNLDFSNIERCIEQLREVYRLIQS